MTQVTRSPVTRVSLFAAVGLILVALLLTTAVRVSQLLAPKTPAVAVAAPLDAVELVFIDEPDGSIQVRRGGDRALVQLIKPGTGGFVRGVMRGFARDRMERGFGAGPPFLLSLSKAGQLTLTDMATGRITVLEAFGSTNRAAFASMLPDQVSEPAAPSSARGS